MKINRSLILFFLAVCFNDLFPQENYDTLRLLKTFEVIKVLESRNIDSSFLLSKKCYTRAKKLGFRSGMALGLNHIGYYYLIIGRNDSAMYYFRQALSESRIVKKSMLEADTWVKLSNAFFLTGTKDSAFYSIYKALTIYESLNDSINTGLVYGELGELFFKYGEDKKAREYLSRAIFSLARNGDSLALSRALINLSIMYYEKDSINEALSNFIRAKNIHVYLNHERFLAKDYNYLGFCFEALMRDSEAINSYRKSLFYFNKWNMLPEISEVIFNIGAFYNNRMKKDSAIFYFEKVIQILQRAKSDNVKLRAYSVLANLYAEEYNYQKAYDYHVKYSTLNDSLLNTEKVKSIAEMQTKYETEKKEQQITLLDHENKTKAAQRNFFIAGSIVLLLLLFVLGFYYVQRNRLARKNEQIAREQIGSLLKEQEIKSYNAMIEGQEEERKRIATDLHDRLGSMLSTVKLLFSTLNEKIDKNQEENLGQYNKATGLLDEAVLEVRRISHNLSTGMVNTFGLVLALEELCESIDKSQIVKCKLLCYGMDERLDQQTEIGLFRIVQELVNNALKHSKAKQLTIQLNRTEESLNLTVEDDGVGFEVEEKKKRGGMGLKNLEARAAKLNGFFHVDSKPGRGTISIVEIPLT